MKNAFIMKLSFAMKRVYRISKIICLFILLTFLITYAWYAVATIFFNQNIKFADFWLYIIGYGDIQDTATVYKMIFSTIGILALSLLTSVFTVSLFDFRRRLEIDKTILIRDRDNLKGTIVLRNNRYDVYDVNITLHLDIDDDRLNTGDKNEYYSKQYPYISKYAFVPIDFQIQPGTILYKYIRGELINKKNSIDPKEVAFTVIINFIDSRDGQVYYACNKYHYDVYHKKSSFLIDYSIENMNRISRAIFAKAIKSDYHKYDNEFEAELTKNCFRLEMDSFNICCSKHNDIDIKLHEDTAKASKRDTITATLKRNKPAPEIDMDTSQPALESEDFCMIVMQQPMSGDWKRFCDMDCSFSFGYDISSGITLTVQAKCRNLTKHIIDKGLKGKDQFVFRLRDYPDRDDLADVEELCFCVKNKDMKSRKGEFSITGCEFIVSQAESDNDNNQSG